MEYADILNSRRPNKYKNMREEGLNIFEIETSRMIKNILNEYFRNEVKIEDDREKIQKDGINLAKVFNVMTSDKSLNSNKVNDNKDISCIDYLMNWGCR